MKIIYSIYSIYSILFLFSTCSFAESFDFVTPEEVQYKVDVIDIYNPISKDTQPADIYCSERNLGILYLHSWLKDHTQLRDDTEAYDYAFENGLSFVTPRFRGADLIYGRNYTHALQDIRQAVLEMKARCDTKVVIAYGASGGGWMLLNFVAKYPDLIDISFADVFIPDLNRWRNQHKFSVYKDRFYKEVTQLCKKKGKFSRRKCKRRSPMSKLKKLRKAGEYIGLLGSLGDNVVKLDDQKDFHFKLIKYFEYNGNSPIAYKFPLYTETDGHVFHLHVAYSFFKEYLEKIGYAL